MRKFTALFAALAVLALATPARADGVLFLNTNGHRYYGTAFPFTLSFGSGLGAVAQFNGPVDQTFELLAGTPSSSGNGKNLLLSAGLANGAGNAGGSILLQSALSGTGTTAQTLLTIANSGALSWSTGLGAIPHLTGPSDQPLKLAGGSGQPITFGSSIQFPAAAQSTSPYTLAVTDYYQAITTGASNFTVNLPACVAGMVGRKYLVKKVDNGAGAIILAPNGTDTIEGTNANAQFAGVTSSASSDSKGQFSYVEVLCRAVGAWDVTAQMIAYGAALTSGTPSTWTATVPTGTRCVCSDATTQANPVKCNVSSTTLTATGIATNTDVVNALCTF